MPNHFHLVVETPQPNLVVGMRWFLSTYTARYNRRHREFGHLFSGRYKSLIVDGSGNGYLKTVCDYVHLNPARAGLVRRTERLRQYRWSSWPEYLKRAGQRVGWLRVDRLLGEYRLAGDSAAGRRRLEAAVEERRRGKEDVQYAQIRRGWFLGEAKLKQELLGQMQGWLGGTYTGAERRESDEALARGILAQEMKRLGWSVAELGRRRKGDPGKVAIARRLRMETPMTLQWIAAALQMGTWTYLSNLLAQARKTKGRQKCQ